MGLHLRQAWNNLQICLLVIRFTRKRSISGECEDVANDLILQRRRTAEPIQATHSFFHNQGFDTLSPSTVPLAPSSDLRERKGTSHTKPNEVNWEPALHACGNGQLYLGLLHPLDASGETGHSEPRHLEELRSRRHPISRKRQPVALS